LRGQLKYFTPLAWIPQQLSSYKKKCYIDASQMKSANIINHLKSFFSWERAIVILLVLLGALLRVRQYLTGRSLWADEAMLALNIVNRNFAGMFKPLDYDQGAPIGFLLVEKLFNSVLGKNELALRLFPLIIGLISLWLFYLLLKRITSVASGAGLLTALALFAFNPRLVYYSSEVKQYILDVAVTILLLLLVAPVFNTSPRKKDFAGLTLAGLIALWFSHPALFVLAGIGLTLVAIYLKKRDYSNLRLVIGIGLLWILDIIFLYWLILKDISQNAYMREYWQGAFLPMPPWSDPGWFPTAIHENIGIQFGIPYAVWFVFLIMLIGWVGLLFQNQNYAIAFACILLVTLTASALGLYPLFERMILFLIPIGLILIGSTIQAFYQKLQKYQILSTLAVLLLAGYLIYGPVSTSIANFVAPKYFEHIRPSMDFVRDSWKEGDRIYVSYGALPAFRFYAPFYGLENISYEFGRREDYKNPQNILSQLDSFKGQPRVWILLSHVYENGDFNEKDSILNYLNQIGERKHEFRVAGTSVFLYLYDLKN
jgi:Dolichyl-phosphate-mannose-protein mannosyltransferase